jgi:hypothetical protein
VERVAGKVGRGTRPGGVYPEIYLPTASPGPMILLMSVALLDGSTAPKTIGNMRASGVRSLLVSCRRCLHETTVNLDKWPGQMRVPTLGSRTACAGCGAVGVDVRPNWREQASRMPGSPGVQPKR